MIVTDSMGNTYERDGDAWSAVAFSSGTNTVTVTGDGVPFGVLLAVVNEAMRHSFVSAWRCEDGRALTIAVPVTAGEVIGVTVVRAR